MRNGTLYIHIGYPKTGTTTFQRNLFEKHSDVSYLSPKDVNIASIMKDVFYCRENYVKRNLDQYRKEILESLQKFPTNKGVIVLSNESLTSFSMFFRTTPRPNVWTLEPNSIARKLKTVFRECGIFNNVKILISIRKQEEMLKSMYAQVYNLAYKRFRVTKTFDRFLDYALKEANCGFILDALHYNDVVEVYSECFGSKNVEVLVFEEMKDDFQAYLGRICSIMDIDEGEATKLTDVDPINKRSSETGVYRSDERNLVELLVPLKKKWIGERPLVFGHNKLIKRLENVYVPGRHLKNIELTNESRDILKKEFSDSNKILSERLNLKLERYGYF